VLAVNYNIPLLEIRNVYAIKKKYIWQVWFVIVENFCNVFLSMLRSSYKIHFHE